MSEGGTRVDAELDRDIGFVGAMALGVGTMIAAGIFVLSGLAVANVGAMAIVSFLIAAVVASFTAFAYAEFAAIYPESGGGYAYVSNVFDTDLTYIVGWSMILGYPASAAFYLASFSDWFFRFLYPALSIPRAVPYWVSGLAVLLLLVVVNLAGTEETGLFQIVVTALKIGLIVLFLAGGLQAFDASVVADSFAANLTAFRDIGLTSALVFITFFGFEAIATNAEEIEDPGRTVPRAIFVSMGFVTLVYTLVVLVIVVAVNDGAFLDFLSSRADLGGLAPREFVARNGEVSMGRAAQYYLGDFGFFVVIVGALFSMLSAANATILAGSRVKLAMARRDHLPGRFESLHPSLNTPYQSVLLTGGFILLFVVTFSVVFGGVPGQEDVTTPFGLHLGVEALAHFADFMLLTGLVFVNLAVVQSRRTDPEIDRPFRVPGVPWVPALAVVANLALLVNVDRTSFALGLLAEVVGVLVWVGLVGRASPETLERETPTAIAPAVDDSDYCLLVAVANPENVPQLMRTARDLVAARGGSLLVTSVVTLPDQTPLSEGHRYVDDRRTVVEDAIASVDDPDVPVSGTVRIAHHPGRAIHNTARQYDCDGILMGWSDSGRRRDIVLGSVVDEVVVEAPCDVFVERIGPTSGRVASILLPTAGGVHLEAAATIAAAVAAANDAPIEAFHVLPPDASESRRAGGEAALDRAAELLEPFGVTVERTLVEADNVAGTIVDRSADHDLTVVGATGEGLLQQLVFGAVPERVGREAHGTVVMAKRSVGVTGRLRHWAYRLRPR